MTITDINAKQSNTSFIERNWHLIEDVVGDNAGECALVLAGMERAIRDTLDPAMSCIELEAKMQGLQHIAERGIRLVLAESARA